MTNNVSRKRGKPAGGVSLITVPMQDVMNACNASALVTIGRVWGEKMGIIKEGYDFFEVHKQSKIAIDDVRNNRRPVFLKINTARYKEHVGPGEDFSAGYRNESDINKWKTLDPIIINKEIYLSFLPKINKEVEGAVKFGIESALPDKKDLFSDV